jgi:nicotinamidase-related amidase
MAPPDLKSALLLMDFQNGVLSVRSALRPGFPDGHPLNQAITRVRSLGPDTFVDGSDFTAFHPALGDISPTKDIVVTKRRNSALAGTDLEVVLRSLGVQHLIVAGVMTSGCVLSTVRQAADLDYKVTVVENLCMDRDEDVQEVLMRKVFSAQGDVVSAAEVMGQWVGKNPAQSG